ncbi:UrcA family protein [Sphingomonas sp.]|uniref:UrcA family protein n=1 Tax=Sphingomonas sp. TaxID=28214 RepID=UPI003BACDFB6
MTPIHLIAAMAAALSLTGPAMAGARSETRRIAVPAAGLDLSTEAGIDILAARIDHAVKRICGRDRRCADGAWQSTEWQVDRLIREARTWRRLADERAAQLRGCRERCAPPVAWSAPVVPVGVTVVVVRD